MTTVSSPSESRFSLADAAGPSGVLRLLFWLRMVAIASQLLAIAFVEFLLDTSLPLRELGLTIGALALWNALNYGPVHADRRVQDAEVALHLAVDIAALTSVLYFTGGSTNPFVSLYLVPISLAATSLPARYAWLIGGLCGAGYSFLWRRSVPLPSVDFDLHLTGMWVNFAIAAVLIVLFVGRMARLVRERDRELAAMRETALRDQQIVELGTLAAGTAHELNTPLSTLAILVEELDERATDPEQKKQLRVMMEEIKVINERLNRIVGGVGAERSAGARQVALARVPRRARRAMVPRASRTSSSTSGSSCPTAARASSPRRRSSRRSATFSTTRRTRRSRTAATESRCGSACAARGSRSP